VRRAICCAYARINLGRAGRTASAVVWSEMGVSVLCSQRKSAGLTALLAEGRLPHTGAGLPSPDLPTLPMLTETRSNSVSVPEDKFGLPEQLASRE
jgi:hypothetical protein